MNAITPPPIQSIEQTSSSISTIGSRLWGRFESLERIRLSEMANLFRRSISALTLSTPEFPARARVARVEGNPWFDFADEVDDDRPIESALAFLARDELGEPSDLVAWSPTSDRVASWLWCAPVLGLETLWMPRIADNGALPVYSSAWSWLRQGRDGLLIVDLRRSIPILRDVGTLVADTVDLGIEIRRHVRANSPKIMVREKALAE